jgi:tetratricopeptide (TPR) repeat protein
MTLCLWLAAAHAGFAPMTASPAELRAAASEAFPLDDDTGTVWRSVVLELDERGHSRRVQHEILRIGDPDYAPPMAWGYAPWHDKPPILRARVVHPDGTVHELDPGTLRESVVGDSGNRIVSDAKVVRFDDLPMVAGAVVEWVVEDQEHRPFLGESASGREPLLGSLGRLHAGELVVRSPRTVPFDWQVHGHEPARIQEKVKKGVRQLTVTLEDVAPIALSVREARWVEDPSPWLEYSTFGSWAAVRDAYARLVDPIYDPEGATARLSAEAEANRIQRIRAHLDTVNEAIRYTGVEFGHQSIVPYAPTTVCDRGFGDCKDQATLLSSLLREDGIEAYVALLQAGFEPEDPKPLPNPTHFNHAIVYVPGDPGLWIDPTSPVTPVGSLPTSDHARYALVISPDFDDLVQTPSPTGQVSYTYRYDRRGEQMAVDVDIVRSGWPADFERYRLIEAQGEPEVLVAGAASREWGTEEVHDVTVDAVARHDGPFRVRYRLSDWGWRSGADDDVPTEGPAFSRWLDIGGTLDAARYGADVIGDDTLVRVDPQRVHNTIEVTAPPGFGPLLEDGVALKDAWNVGPASLARDVAQQDDTWTFTFDLELPTDRLSLGDLRALSDAAQSFPASVTLGLGADPTVPSDDAVRRLRRAAEAFEAHADDADVAASWVALLSSFGHDAAALTAARAAAERFPGHTKLAFEHARALGRDALGGRSEHVGTELEHLAELWDTDAERVRGVVRNRWLASQAELAPPFLADEATAAALIDRADAAFAADPGAWIPKQKLLRRYLLQLGRYDRVVDEPIDADTTWVPYEEDQVWLAALTLRDGLDAGLDELGRVDQESRWTTAHNVAVILTRLRQYAPATAFLTAARGDADDALEARAQLEDYTRLQRWEERWDADGPLAAVAAGIDMAQRQLLRAERPPAPRTLARREWDVRVDAMEVIGADDVPVHTAIDWALAQADVQLGAAAGVDRVRAKLPGRRALALFVTDGRLVATSNVLAGLGDLALAALEDGDQAGAATLLGWAGETRGPADSPYRAFREAWKSVDHGDASQLRLLGELLAASDGTDRALERLETRDGLDDAVGTVLARGWFARGDAERAASALADREVSPSLLQVHVFREAGQHDRAAEVLDAVDAADARSDYFAERRRLEAARGDAATAVAAVRAEIERVGPADESLRALLIELLLHDGALSQAAEEARELWDYLEVPEARTSLLVAVAQVDGQAYAEAWRTLQQAREGTELPATWHFLLGRLAESAGQADAAIRHYHAVPSGPTPDLAPWHAAAERAAVLERTSR